LRQRGGGHQGDGEGTSQKADMECLHGVHPRVEGTQ
jgi:hypothetical protein